MSGKDDSWHLDTKISLGLVLGLIVNAVLGVWYASKLDSRVSTLEQEATISRLESVKLRDSIENERERIIRVEVTLEAILGELKGIKLRMPATENKIILQ